MLGVRIPFRTDSEHQLTFLSQIKQKILKPLRFQDFSCRVLTEKMRSGKFQASVASYIESYNTQRPHRTLENLTPCQVEENSIEKARVPMDLGVDREKEP